MKSRLGNVIWILIAFACGTAVAADEIRWAPDIPTARKAAIQFNVPMLIHFYGDNCIPCKTLEQRVFNKPELVDTLNKYFICVKVNATQNMKIAVEYQVHSWPTDVFVSPDGKTLYQGVCQQDLQGYLGVLQNVAVMNRDRNIMLAAQKSTQSPTQQPYTGDPTQAAQALASANQAVTAPPRTQVQPASPTAGQLVANETQLPNPSESTPGFYKPTASQGTPHLEQSVAPNAGVSSGPLTATNQPTAIVGAVQSEDQQIAVSNQQPANFGGHQSQLPPPVLTGQVSAPASNTAGRSTAMDQHFGIPTLSQNNPAAPAPRQNAFALASSTGQVNAQFVSNPYYSTPNTTPPADAAVGNESTSENPLLLELEPTPQEAKAQATAVPQQSTVPENATTEAPQSEPNPVAKQASNEPQPKFEPRTPQPKDETSLGMEGYCPVSLAAKGAWTTGDAKFAVKHRGKIYWLSDQAAMQQFLSAPDRYSPVLAGYDPLVFLEEGRLVEGSIQFGLLDKASGTYMLFSTAEGKGKYWNDFARYSTALDALMNDQVQAAGN